MLSFKLLVPLSLSPFFLYMQAGSFAHTEQILIQLEASAMEEIRKLGGNPQLEVIVLKLAELYKQEQKTT